MSRSLAILLKFIGLAAFVALAILAAGFFAVRFGWSNVKGESDPNSSAYNNEFKNEENLEKNIEQQSAVLPLSASIYGPFEKNNWCKIEKAAAISPYNARLILGAYTSSHSDLLLRRMLLALSLRLPERSAFEQQLADCEKNPGTATLLQLNEQLSIPQGKNLYDWQNDEPWQIIRQGLLKDKDTINKAAAEAGIQPRLLVSVVIVEQLRLYYTQRELFEKIFKPLKILANANKMAWGVMSIKEGMAIETENHLKDSASPYYLGAKKSHLLDFPATADRGRERYRRLTDDRSHYYSYLYGALILKQLQEQWARAGHPIEYRPEVVATLFNIGFKHSQPKPNPEVGGSTILINGHKYYFGSLAYEFYYSGDLMEEFPYK